MKNSLLALTLVTLATPVTAAKPTTPAPTAKVTLDDVLAVCRQYLIEADKNNDPEWLGRFLAQAPVDQKTREDIAVLCTFHHQGAHDMLTLKMPRT